MSELHGQNTQYQVFPLENSHVEKPGITCLTRVTRLRERLRNPDGMLSRTDLRELGLERRAVDAVFRAVPVVVLPGYARPLIRVGDYLALLEASTFDGERVR